MDSYLKNAVKFAGGLDIRTTGGYILLPPSKHRSGKDYRWITSPTECELATAPQWLIDVMPKHEQPKAKPFVIERAKTDYEKCVLYLEKCSPAIEGNNGSGVAFATICRVVELFGLLTDDEIIEALTAWNSRCVPAWSESELRHKLADARKKNQTTQEQTEPVAESEIDYFPTLSNNALIGIVGDIVRRAAITIIPEIGIFTDARFCQT